MTPAQLRSPVTLVTGYFDVLRAEHARELQGVRERTSDRRLAVVVLQNAGELMEARARAEIVAALRVVDYVLIAKEDELDRLLACLRPAETVRWEEVDLRRTRCLIEHVQRGQNR